MVCKLIVQGKEFDIEILDNQLKELLGARTGYDVVELTEHFYYVDENNNVCNTMKINDCDDDMLISNANCYSSSEIAANNARADKLMRQLRRFAVEHRKDKFNWLDDDQAKYMITYRHETNILIPEDMYTDQDFGTIYFDSAEVAYKAIDTFKEELVWYFTEYKDGL